MQPFDTILHLLSFNNGEKGLKNTFLNACDGVASSQMKVRFMVVNMVPTVKVKGKVYIMNMQRDY